MRTSTTTMKSSKANAKKAKSAKKTLDKMSTEPKDFDSKRSKKMSKANGYGMNRPAGTKQDPFLAATDKGISTFMSESIERSDSDYDDFEVEETIAVESYSIYRPELDTHKKQCIEQCMTTAENCTLLINYCLNMGEEHANPTHINLLSICADVCNLTARALSLDSEFEATICELAAEVCERCAWNCREISESDERMQNCADMCQECADTCSEMIQFLR